MLFSQWMTRPPASCAVGAQTANPRQHMRRDRADRLGRDRCTHGIGGEPLTHPLQPTTGRTRLRWSPRGDVIARRGYAPNDQDPVSLYLAGTVLAKNGESAKRSCELGAAAPLIGRRWSYLPVWFRTAVRRTVRDSPARTGPGAQSPSAPR